MGITRLSFNKEILLMEKLNKDRMDRMEDKLNDVSSDIVELRVAMVANSSNLTNFIRGFRLFLAFFGAMLLITISYGVWATNNIVDNSGNIASLGYEMNILVDHVSDGRIKRNR